MATILSDAAFPSNSAVLVFAPDVELEFAGSVAAGEDCDRVVR